jgi:hypothetical protein
MLNRTKQKPADANVRTSHLIADAETTRTHALRTLQRQVDLLTNATHAVQHGRTHTAEEFIERVRSALDSEINYLKSRQTSAE